ncbi:MAG: phage scaffolding protein [Deltaproteobacteria bacterium]|nr:phage scaffolding protein [Deltaproteobacteria bacterium]
MPLPKSLLDKLKAKLKDDKDLFTELESAQTEASELLDTTKAEAAEHKKNLSKAEKDRDKHRSDLEAKSKGEGEELSQFKAERDQYKAAAEAADGKLAETRREYAIREQLVTKHGLRDGDGLKLLDTSGVTLDDKGALVGLDKAIKGWRESKPYLFGEAKPPANDGGRGPGAGDNRGQGGGGGGNQPTAADRARAILLRQGILQAPAPPQHAQQQ